MLRYLEIKEELTERIGGMEVGARLPCRTTLCREMATTRTTLDRAIGELLDEGILRSRKGSGTYVVGLLKDKKSRMENWGVIVPDATVDVFPKLIDGIRTVADGMGVNLIVCSTESDLEKQDRYIKRLLASGVSGFIIVPIVSKSATMSYRLYATLLRSNVPFVFCNRSVEGIDVPTVRATDYHGGYLATRHLIEQGYRKIAYIATQKYQTSMERCEGYLNALLEFGLAIDRTRIRLPAVPASQAYFHATEELLRSPDPPDAFFCFNDAVAEQVYKAISACGKRVGIDIGVIGYDNTKIAEALSPPLTSVDQQNAEIGEMAADLLRKMIDGEYTPSDFGHYLHRPALVERKSCIKQTSTT